MDAVKYFRILSRAAFLLLVFFLIIIIPDCKDPFDFKPDDSLVPPPAAPHLLSPPDSFVRMPGDTSNRILLTWEAVQGAKVYEIRLDGETIPGWTIEYDTNALNMRIDNSSGYILDKFTWKVRAGGPGWQYYTDWSAPGYFEIRYRPPPPQLIAPVNNSIIVCDSLPVFVRLEWAKVQDEHFYNVNVFFGMFPVDDVTVGDSVYTFIADTVGAYYWQVRAGSPHWEYSTNWTLLWKFSIFLKLDR